MRTFQIAVWLAAVMVIAGACKKPDKPAENKADEAAKVADPGPAAPAPAPAAPAPAVPPPGEAKPDEAKPGDVGKNTPLQAKGMEMMTKMGDLFEEHADDCEKLAMELREMFTANKALAAELRTMEAGLSGKEREAYDARNRVVQDEAFAKMGPAMQRCGDKVVGVLRDFR